MDEYYQLFYFYQYIIFVYDLLYIYNFDLNNRDQFLIAVNYNNLQPMWAYNNLSKGKK